MCAVTFGDRLSSELVYAGWEEGMILIEILCSAGPLRYRLSEASPWPAPRVIAILEVNSHDEAI